MGGSAAEAMAFATSAKRHPVKHRAVTMTGASQPVYMLTTLSTSALMSSVSFALLSQQVLWSLLHHLLFRVLPLFAGQSTRRAHTIRLADYLIKEPAKSSCFGKKVSLWAELGLAKDDKNCNLIDVGGSYADNLHGAGLDAPTSEPSIASAGTAAGKFAEKLAEKFVADQGDESRSSCSGVKVPLWKCAFIDVGGSDADNRPGDGLDESAERLDHAEVSDIVDTENEIGHGMDPYGLAIHEIETDASNASAELIFHAKASDMSDIANEIRHGMVHCGPAINEFEVDDPSPRLAEFSESAPVPSEVQHSATVAATAECRRSVAPASAINTSDPPDSDDDGSGQSENSDDEYEWDVDTNPIKQSHAPIAPEGFWDRLRYQVYHDFLSAGHEDLVKLHDGQMQGHCLQNIASTHERLAAATPLQRDSRRDLILHCLNDALHTASGRLASDGHTSYNAGLADEIEQHLFSNWTGDDYLIQARIIAFHLRDPRNAALRQRLREGSYSAIEIVNFCTPVRSAFLSDS